MIALNFKFLCSCALKVHMQVHAGYIMYIYIHLQLALYAKSLYHTGRKHGLAVIKVP